jgi:steroid delta-isomerase-like uncharacterized protein
MAGTENNKAIELRFTTEVLNEHNLDVLSELVAEDFIEQNPAPGQGAGREGLRQVLAQMIEAFPDMSRGTEEEVAEGDRVAGWGFWSGTHRGGFMGIPADRPHSLRGVREYGLLPRRQDRGESHHHGRDGTDAAAGVISGPASAEATGEPA